MSHTYSLLPLDWIFPECMVSSWPWQGAVEHRRHEAQIPGTIRVCDEYISDSSNRGGMNLHHHSRAQGQLCKGSEDYCSPMKQTSVHMPDKSDTSPGHALVIPTHSCTFQHAWNIPTGLLILHRDQHVARVAPRVSRCLSSLTSALTRLLGR